MTIKQQGKGLPFVVFFIPFLTDFAAMLLIFTVSRNLAELEVGLLWMGIVGAAHAFIASASSFIFGRLSDRVGRAQVIVPGILLLFASAFVCICVPFGHWLFLAMYWLGAFSLGLIHPATIAWINTGEERHSYGKSVSRNLIRFCIAWNLGVLSAQYSGGWLFLFGPNTPLACAASIALLNLLVVLHIRYGGVASRWAMRDTDGDDKPAVPAAGDSLHGLSDTFVQLSWLANLGGAFSVSMILHLFPQLAVSLGVPPNQHGAILAMMRVVVICVYVVLHHTDFWKYRYFSTLAVQSIAVVGLFILFFAQEPIGLYLGVGGLAILTGFNYFSGIYYSNAGHQDDQRGFASGMHEASLGLGIAAGSLCGGVAGSIGGERIPYVLAVIVILVLTGIQIALYTARRAASRSGA